MTGAGGFIGSHVVRALLGRGCRVRALLEPATSRANLEGLELEVVEVDVRDHLGVAAAVGGATVVVHAAALYRFWDRDPDRFYEVNVVGTRNVVAAAAEANARTVYTSTVGTIGLPPPGGVSSEADHARIEQLYGHYKRSKYVAEHEALRLAAAGADVVLVHPTFPVGGGDRAPTPTGETILRFLRGGMPAYVNTVLNVVHVGDVAAGHLLAAEAGLTGRSYVLGGENMSLEQVLAALSDHTGLPAPAVKLPPWAALAVGWLSTVVQGSLLRRQPVVPLEAAHMAASWMAFDDSRARSELGYKSRPAAEGLREAADWFADNGYLGERRLARVRLGRPPRG